MVQTRPDDLLQNLLRHIVSAQSAIRQSTVESHPSKVFSDFEKGTIIFGTLELHFLGFWLRPPLDSWRRRECGRALRCPVCMMNKG